MSELKPCPFCGDLAPSFRRIGTSRQSCIVICNNCGARHESSDEYERSGESWNERAPPTTNGDKEGEREAFELWAYSNGWRNFTRDEHSGRYVVEGDLELRWIGWQGRAAKAPPTAREGDALDAARYRWLKGRPSGAVNICAIAWGVPEACGYDTPDQAIDAAMGASALTPKEQTK